MHASKKEIIDLLWKDLLGYVHEGHVNGFEKAIKEVAEKLTASHVNDIGVVEMPYSPEYVAKLKDALQDMLLTYQTAIDIVGNKTFVGILKGAGVCNEEDEFNHVMNKAKEVLK